MSVPGRLVVILGPTASGKSALGIHLAQKLGGEIVVCDSTQVYRRFDIGTAKVSADARWGVPHWMMDIVEPADVFTAGDYRQRAEEVLRVIHARGRVPIVTAGTGLYLRALLEGLADAPARSEEFRARLRHSAKRSGPAHLHRILRRLDPGAAARIAAPDTQKIIRALELRFLTKKPVGEIHAQGRAPLEGFTIVKIGLRPPRAALYARIERRVHEMFDAGWLAEVRELLRSGVSPGAKPFTFIGYREILARDSAELKLEETILEIQKATRQFAKRQLTWFRKEPNVHWLDSFGDNPAAESQALALL
ncbi:MAG: tRNA (adenosine(37)-N6)-dimethylallyltransferase MiaA [Candidatus Acidiferrales bacterium]|jgi:tRNA dimethylallyltransferase